MKEAEIRDVLRRRYDRTAFTELLRPLFAHLEIFKAPQSLILSSEKVEMGFQIGRVNLQDGKFLALFDIALKPESHIARNRVELRNLIVPFVDQDKAHAILAVFHSSDQEDYRLSLVSRETSLAGDGTLTRHETQPKRFTFVCGPGESCATAGKRLAELCSKASKTKLEDVVGAFSVEKLNEEFFGKYKERYEKFTAWLIQHPYRSTVFGLKAGETEKPIRDYVKLLLGRIVFLHFLQKKGWLGCSPKDKDWANGNRRFLQDFFQSFKDKAHFQSQGLSPLFFDTLNNARRAGDLFEGTGTRIPYLNGGLFDEDFPKAREMDFPQEFFADLLGFFDEYNFTIDENSPEDHDVGIDPEMLGHIFENLLEDNKEKGAYYTPKSVVQYMCRESLLHYLKTRLDVPPDNVETLERFVRIGDKGAEKDKHNWIWKNAKRIEEALDVVKVCDPAIGSGAFPIGMMQEILRLKLLLDWTLDKATAKKRIIQHSIYGVDKEKGAVDIARLRFWLALVVDEDEPSPLPNLDYKIMQGDSLLESFLGISLRQDFSKLGDDITVSERNPQRSLFTNTVEDPQLEFKFNPKQKESIAKLMQRYFEASRTEKENLHRQIDRQVAQLIDQKLEEGAARLKAEMISLKKHQQTGKILRQIESNRTELHTLERGREEVASWDHRVVRPFFLWHLFFGNVLKDGGGFDIVIGNPPYVRQEALKGYKDLLKKEGYQCFDGMADLLVYFFEKGLHLLKPNGALCLIASNKYFRAGYAEKLRELLAKRSTLIQIVDFGELPVFDAGTDPAITILHNASPPLNHDVFSIAIKDKQAITDLITIVPEKSKTLPQKALQPRGWTFESPAVLRLLEKLRRVGKPLNEVVSGRFYYGIKTGLNDAFVVNRDTRDYLIRENKSSKELLKPFLQGHDVKEWRAEFDEWYLIKIASSENEKHPWSGLTDKEAEKVFAKTYPAIYSHFQALKHVKLEKPDARGCLNMLEKLQRRDDQGKYFWELRSCIYWPEFEKTKLVFNETSKELHAFFDDSKFYTNKTLFNLIAPQPKPLLAVLMSRPLDWLFRHEFPSWGDPWKGGRVQFRGDRMATVPIPDFPPKVEQSLTKLVDRIITAKARDALADVSEWENEIDELVYELYGLTEDEIALVKKAKV